eukprot:1159504-Pelagomonas_calceolata.AAC.17
MPACPESACPVSGCLMPVCPVPVCPVPVCPVPACPVSACPVGLKFIYHDDFNTKGWNETTQRLIWNRIPAISLGGNQQRDAKECEAAGPIWLIRVQEQYLGLCDFHHVWVNDT